MKRPAPLAVAAGVLVALALAAACGSGAREGPPSAAEADPTIVRGGAPGSGSAHTEVEVRPDAPGHIRADVRFMQDMIVHHGQALEMTALVPERTRRDDIRRLARRIETAQADEIARMRRWLEDRGETVPSLDGSYAGDERAHGGRDEHAHDQADGGHAPGALDEHAGMAGMLTREQLARLAAAEGEEFDRLFLEHMIVHHEGALVMVGRLFATPGAAQETEIYMLASHVDADQRAEIARMRRLLDIDT